VDGFNEALIGSKANDKAVLLNVFRGANYLFVIIKKVQKTAKSFKAMVFFV
jgi:hypothetical protein